jgi:hypothetical protein
VYLTNIVPSGVQYQYRFYVLYDSESVYTESHVLSTLEKHTLLVFFLFLGLTLSLS